MIPEQLNLLLKQKVDYCLGKFIGDLEAKEYNKALTCYKMAKCILPDFDHQERDCWANLLYHLGYLFKSGLNSDAAAYCLDRVIELCPEWDAAHYARSCVITSPIEHNTLGSIDLFYSNEKLAESYLCAERIKFYSDFIEICTKEGVDFYNKDLVDVGCGTGFLLHLISERVSVTSLTGFDFSGEAIRIAKQKCTAGHFFQYDIYVQNKQKFDIVICTETLEHLLFPEKALQNLLLMTKDEGCVILSVPNGRLDTFDGHINFWSPESWRIFVEKNCGYCQFSFVLLNGRHNIAVIRKT